MWQNQCIFIISQPHMISSVECLCLFVFRITKLLEGEVFSQLDTEHIVHFMQKAQDTAMAARNRKEVYVKFHHIPVNI